MNYQELLTSNQWKSKRKVILDRDNNKCVFCNNLKIIRSGICVFYFDYNDIDTFILCNHFNSNESKTTSVKVFKNMNLPNSGMLIIGEDINNEIGILANRKFINNEAQLYNLNKFDSIKATIEKYNVLDIDYKKFIAAKSLRIFPNRDFIMKCFQEKYPSFSIEFSTIINSKPEEVYVDYDNQDWIVHISLHVHHTYYQNGLMPWEYPNDSLLSVCWICHENIHKSEKIPVKDFLGNIIANYTPCIKCCGAGYIPKYFYRDKGICYKCYGAKYEELIK
ncbi:MAG: hypothetical protein RI955_1638 [Bacteroidota bacterium]